MASLLAELLVGLGFEYDPEDADEFNKDTKKSTESIKKLTTVAIGAASALTAMAIASTISSDEQGKLADEVGETVGNIDALQFALKRSGGTADGMTSSLRQLSIRASEAARGVGSGVEAFGLLGISSTDVSGNLKSSSELMLEISQRFQGLSRSKQIELADKLGIKDSIRLLQQGPKAIKSLVREANELGVTTEEDAKFAAEFQDSLTDLWQIFKQVGRVLAKTLLPTLKSINESFTEWWKNNREILGQKLRQWIDNIVLGLKILTVAILLANASALLLPILIGAVLAAIILLAEDAKVFFEGGESFIGDMLKKYPKWKTQLEEVKVIFAVLAELTTMIFDGWRKIFDLDFGKFAKDLPDFLTGVFGGETQTDIAVRKLLAPTPAATVGGGSRTTVDKVEINVNGAGDPVQVANEVSKVFQQTSQDLNTAVDQ